MQLELDIQALVSHGAQPRFALSQFQGQRPVVAGCGKLMLKRDLLRAQCGVFTGPL